MRIEFIDKKNIKKTHSLSELLNIILSENNEIINDLNRHLSCSFYDSNEFVFFYDSGTAGTAVAIHDGIKRSFIYFVRNFLDRRKITIKNSFDILSAAETLDFNENEFIELSGSINWQSNVKARYYFDNFKKCTDMLKKIVFKNKTSVKDAIYFHNAFKNKNYDIILSLISDNFSFSQVSEIIKHIAEYAVIKNADPENIYNYLIAKNNIREEAFKLKYPLYSAAINKFNDYIECINLPVKSEISFDKTFEKEDYQLNIKFHNLKDLNAVIDNVKKALQKIDDKPDMFDHDNLFKG